MWAENDVAEVTSVVSGVKMKKFFAVLLLVLMCGASAQADSIKIGDTIINFDRPIGYILAEGEKFAKILSWMGEGVDTTDIRAVYVERGAAERFVRDGGALAPLFRSRLSSHLTMPS